jgi:nitrite reductase/ring-hydroxylating ferredoxin subunit
VFALGTNVNREAFEPIVDQFKAVASASALEDGKLFGAELELAGARIPLVLLKRGRSIMALSGTCTHWGGPLAEGKLVDGDCVECPLHGSQFNLADGSVCQGPATAPAHVFEARTYKGNVEVRRRG